jgi:hypothetical protein
LHLQAVEAGALRHLAVAVEEGHQHQPEEAEVGPLRREEVAAVQPGHADHEGLLDPAALQAGEEVAAEPRPLYRDRDQRLVGWL